MQISSSISIWNNNIAAFSGGGASYLVDDYSPTVAFGVRKLSSTATNCLRIRRSSDSTEQDIGFSGNDLDTASISSFVGGGSAWVTKWYNQGTSGSGADLVQATASNQPRIVNSGTIDTDNGTTCLYLEHFDHMQSTNHDTAINQRSVFIVHSMIVNSLNYGLLGVNTGTGNDYDRTDSYVFQMYNNIRADQYAIAGSTSSTYLISIGSGTPTAFTQALHTEIISGTTGTLYKNTSSIGSDSSFTAFSSGATNRLLLGARFLSGSVSSGVAGESRCQEIIFFGTDQTSNKAALESDINGYYSIY